jgi:hypothetical protein
LAVTDRQLEQARQREEALARAQREEPARFDAFARRMAALEQRIRALIPQVAALSREQQAEVQDLAVAALTQQKERLVVYATQARFAVAQLYDRATVSTTAARPPEGGRTEAQGAKVQRSPDDAPKP